MSSKKRKQIRKLEVNQTTPNSRTVKVKPKSKNQRDLLQSIYNNDLTFAVGPAGTGKTHIAVGAAVDLLQRKKINKIVITRPMIEAGHRLNNNKSVIGYLPGDISAKMSPYLRPIYDEFSKFLSLDSIEILKKNNILEICPIEHMRGRTFEYSYILCDEAQNATEEQLEMLLTRLGVGSTMIVAGDIDQTDLADYLVGGFENFIDDLDGLAGLGIIYLETCDVARHPIVIAILERRKQVKELLSKPASFERLNHVRQSTGHSPKNASPECQHDANSDNSLDGLIQEDL